MFDHSKQLLCRWMPQQVWEEVGNTLQLPLADKLRCTGPDGSQQSRRKIRHQRSTNVFVVSTSKKVVGEDLYFLT